MTDLKYKSLGIYPETHQKIVEIAKANLHRIADQVMLIVDAEYETLKQQKQDTRQSTTHPDSKSG